MINLEWLVWEDNPKNIPTQQTHFYKWLQEQPYFDRRIDAVKAYVIDQYDWNLDEGIGLGASLKSLRWIYDSWWWNEMKPLRDKLINDTVY